MPLYRYRHKVKTIGAEIASPELERLASHMRDSAWDLALEVVEDGLRYGSVASYSRLGPLDRAADPQPELLRRGSPLAALARDHARSREALGFAPREIVSEFLLLRRVVWRFVARRPSLLEQDDMFALESRVD